MVWLLLKKRQQGEIKTYVDAMNWASQQAGTDNDQLEALQLAVNISYDRRWLQGLNATDLKKLLMKCSVMVAFEKRN